VDLDANYSVRHFAVKPGAVRADRGQRITAWGWTRPRRRASSNRSSHEGFRAAARAWLSNRVSACGSQSGGKPAVYQRAERGNSVKVYLPRIDGPLATEN